MFLKYHIDNRKGMIMKKIFAMVFFILLSFVASTAQAAFAIAALDSGGESEFHYFWIINAGSEKEAKKIVLKNCESERKKQKYKNACKPFISGAGPAYIAVFRAENGGVGVAYGGNRQTVINNAYDECNKIGTCPNTAENILVDDGPNIRPVAARAKPTKQCSPPAGRVIRSRTSCNNGDCIRTFENGCTIRFKAPYCFDPFSSQWTWKPDGCWLHILDYYLVQ